MNVIECAWLDSNEGDTLLRLEDSRWVQPYRD